MMCAAGQDGRHGILISELTSQSVSGQIHKDKYKFF
jgi:hypothetical protein